MKMKNIISKIESLVNDNINTYLPDVSRDNFEKNGAVYYMNGKNGTEFDWFVNDRLSDFFVFYDDEESLGAIKLNLYYNGDAIIYIYDDNGHHLKEEINASVEVTEEELLKFAVLLKNVMDDEGVWDVEISRINTEVSVTPEMIQEFMEHKTNYQALIERRALFNKSCYVSKILLEEGWKVGYMLRDEPANEMDSGWCFMVGNEDDEYINDYHNIALLSVGAMCQTDPDIAPHIGNPVGTGLIRVSSDSLEIDKRDKPIFFEKREM